MTSTPKSKGLDRSKLQDLLPPQEGVQIGRGTLPLRGLGVEEISSLLSIYKDGLLPFITAQGDMLSLALALPSMCVDIITIASDSASEDRDIIARIPVLYQAECLSKVYTLSVPDEKKLLRLLEKLGDKMREFRVAVDPTNNRSGSTSEIQLQDSLTPSLDGATG